MDSEFQGFIKQSIIPLGNFYFVFNLKIKFYTFNFVSFKENFSWVFLLASYFLINQRNLFIKRNFIYKFK